MDHDRKMLLVDIGYALVILVIGVIGAPLAPSGTTGANADFVSRFSFALSTVFWQRQKFDVSTKFDAERGR